MDLNELIITEDTPQKVEDIITKQSMDAKEKVEKFLHGQDQPTSKLTKRKAIDIPKIDTEQEFQVNGDMTPTPTNTLDEPLFDKAKLDVDSVHYVTTVTSIPQDRDDDILVARENSPRLPRPQGGRRKSQTPEFELKEIPRTLTRAFADQLELPWIYYCLFATCFTSFAVMTEMPIPYFIMVVALCSLISFRILFSAERLSELGLESGR